ncbi:Similar to F-box DNA helicase protein 1; acc. no. Q9USU3 [Pyronema omphalodes CBS 100304]|uniref:Similar to F-box DNA helicase protein 1 acc. no. Q9USU3 n=1 Tax=Pyronema omphalodes (strain CBS 100304) TaxID=1076935 RepID=U4LRK7_PYROM|nr:Similar to F-box DNA helicase protein 1; acc. no. Q9USU3 [Pyronema omphalodes CBS 100304]
MGYRHLDRIQAGTHPYLPHDAYLKLLHLKPSADDIAFQNYDIILLDEAQDSDTCVSDIILRQQQRAGVIVVGDPYQRIYGFRGASNAPFNDVEYSPTITCHLTWNFRFGDNIAGAANILLKAMGEEFPLNGVRKDDAIYDLKSPSMWQRRKEKILGPPREHVVIFRKNTTLVRFGIKFHRFYSKYKMALKVKKNYQKETLFNNLRDGYRLFRGQRTRSTLLKDFESWYQLQKYVLSKAHDNTEQSYLELIFGLECEFEKHTFLNDLNNVAAHVVDNEDEENVILINTHQAKGREWDNVVLADGFIDISDRHHIMYNPYYQGEAGILEL